jgi:CheY-like chemotaxis protein
MPAVLIVDDRKEMRLLWTTVLKDSCHIVVASGGEEAISILKENKPMVVLLDVVMPDVGGYAVLDYIRSNPALEGTKVALITGNSEKRDIEEGILEHKADRYFTKPAHIPDVINWVHQSLARVAISSYKANSKK